jgi:hypothetical protein
VFGGGVMGIGEGQERQNNVLVGLLIEFVCAIPSLQSVGSRQFPLLPNFLTNAPMPNLPNITNIKRLMPNMRP